MPQEYKILKELESSPQFSVSEGLREKDRQKVLTLALRLSPALCDHALPLKEKINKIRSMNLNSVSPVLEIEDHPEGLTQVIQPPGGVPLKKILPEIKDHTSLFLELAISMTETVEGLHQRKILHQGICPCAFFVDAASRKASFFGFGWEIFCKDASNPDAFALAMPYVSPEQTGRINREPDLRSDLYSLGAVFYEMLCGVPPFEASNPLKMFHHCVTAMPLSPSERDPATPKTLSFIVMKLLSKAPEERYQSAFGLKADLEKCMENFKSTGLIEEFSLGEKDAWAGPHIPEKLIGRDRELKALKVP